MPSAWLKFDCPQSSNEYRYLDDGRLEIRGEGTPKRDWLPVLDQWEPLVRAAGTKYDIKPAWIAAIMALETGMAQAAGSPLCLWLGDRCDTGEGIGLMATLTTTASSMAGRTVTANELLNDHELAIDVGTKYLRFQLDRYEGDLLKAAIGYNAGSVRCGRGSTFIPANQDWPKEPCPDTGWGVVMGCAYTSASFAATSPRCSRTSTAGVPPFKCSSDYPRTVAQFLNAAIEDGPYGDGALPVLPTAPDGASALARLAALGIGAVVGWQLVALSR